MGVRRSIQIVNGSHQSDKLKYERFGWFVLPLAFVCTLPATVIGDMILICWVYGPDAYFKQGLRLIKHKPSTLSTGVVLSSGLDQLSFVIISVLWAGFIILGMYLLMGLYSISKGITQRLKIGKS